MMPSIAPNSSQVIPLRGISEPALDSSSSSSEASVRLSGGCSIDMSTAEPASNGTSWGQSVRNACCGVSEGIYCLGNKFTTKQVIVGSSLVALGGLALTAGSVVGALMLSGVAVASNSTSNPLSATPTPTTTPPTTTKAAKANQPADSSASKQGSDKGATVTTTKGVTTLPTTTAKPTTTTTKEPTRGVEKVEKPKVSGDGSKSYACATQEESSVRCKFKTRSGKELGFAKGYKDFVGIFNNDKGGDTPTSVTITSRMGKDATIAVGDSHCFMSSQKITAAGDTATQIKAYANVTAANCETQVYNPNNMNRKLNVYVANHSGGAHDPKIRCGDGAGETSKAKVVNGLVTLNFESIKGPYTCRVTKPFGEEADAVEAEIDALQILMDKSEASVCVRSHDNYKKVHVSYDTSKEDCKKKKPA